MRLVAGVAGRAARMFFCGDLGEGGRLGRVLFMAATAEIGDVGELGLGGGGVVGGGVRVLGSVTGFTGDVGMASGGAGGRLGVVAGDTGVLAGVGDGLGADGVERAGAEVAVAAEIFGDDRGAGDQEDGEADDQNDRGANQMGRVPEQTVQSNPFRMRASGGA